MLVTMLVAFFFCHCNQILDRSNLREEGFILAQGFRGESMVFNFVNSGILMQNIMVIGIWAKEGIYSITEKMQNKPGGSGALTLALGRQRKKDLCEVKASLVAELEGQSGLYSETLSLIPPPKQKQNKKSVRMNNLQKHASS